MNNTEILDVLMNAEGESDIKTNNSLYPSTSNNHNTFLEVIKKWDTTEPFPSDKCLSCIKLNQWYFNEFDYTTQKLIQQFLPPFMLDCFFALKEFRDGSRNELLSTQKAYARLMALPMSTQDEKAYVVYKFNFEQFYENSEINIK